MKDIGFILIGIAICSFLLYQLWLSAREWSKLYCLEKWGASTIGTIIAHKTRSGGKAPRFFVTYKFSIEHDAQIKSCETEQQVSLRHFRNLQENQQVRIRYLTAYPMLSRLWESDKDNTIRDGSSLIALIVMIAVLPLIILWLSIFIVQAVLLSKNRVSALS